MRRPAPLRRATAAGFDPARACRSTSRRPPPRPALFPASCQLAARRLAPSWRDRSTKVSAGNGRNPFRLSKSRPTLRRHRASAFEARFLQDARTRKRLRQRTRCRCHSRVSPSQPIQASRAARRCAGAATPQSALRRAGSAAGGRHGAALPTDARARPSRSTGGAGRRFHRNRPKSRNPIDPLRNVRRQRNGLPEPSQQTAAAATSRRRQLDQPGCVEFAQRDRATRLPQTSASVADPQRFADPAGQLRATAFLIGKPVQPRPSFLGTQRALTLLVHRLGERKVRKNTLKPAAARGAFERQVAVARRARIPPAPLRRRRA